MYKEAHLNVGHEQRWANVTEQNFNIIIARKVPNELYSRGKMQKHTLGVIFLLKKAEHLSDFAGRCGNQIIMGVRPAGCGPADSAVRALTVVVQEYLLALLAARRTGPGRRLAGGTVGAAGPGMTHPVGALVTRRAAARLVVAERARQAGD